MKITRAIHLEKKLLHSATLTLYFLHSDLRFRNKGNRRFDSLSDGAVQVRAGRRAQCELLLQSK
jgi:hypothetical protein